MTKALLIAMTLLSTSALGLNAIPDGTYQGRGRWKDTVGNTGVYLVQTQFDQNRVKATYMYAGGHGRTVEFETRDTGNDFFDVYVAGNKVGHGYCLTVQCQVTLNLGQVTITQDYTYWDGILYNFGSEERPGVRVAFEETYE